MPGDNELKQLDRATQSVPWYRGLTGYHWFVLLVASMGWFFDTMDQQFFVLTRKIAMTDLLGAAVSATDVTRYSGYATSILIVGWATGGIIFGMLGDRWGRAKTMFLAIGVYSVFTGLSSLAVSWIDFTIYRFLCGLGVGGQFAAGVSLVAEVMPARSRPYALGLLQALGSVGNMTACCITFFIPAQSMFQGVQGWRLIFVIGILPAILALFVMRRLREPESWVRAKEAASKAPPEEKHRKLGSYKELFGDPRWRRNAIIGMTLGMAGIMGLWGVGFWMPELMRLVVLPEPTKAYQDKVISLAMLLYHAGAFTGVYAFSLITGVVGRRPAFGVSFLVAFACAVGVFGFMTKAPQVWWVAPLLGFALFTVFGGYSIYFPELFPTRLRATGTGFCYNTARYLAAAAPFTLGTLTAAFAAPAGTTRATQNLSDLTSLSSLGGADDPLRYAAIVVAAVFLLGLVALPWAPETKDKPLPE